MTTSARFASRHLGPRPHDIEHMLSVLGVSDLDTLIDQAVPASIRVQAPLALPPALTEREALDRLAELAASNQIWRSYLGYGYHNTIIPAVIQRNILENPGWYTAYTPYQAEISQGRLEALLNYQTMVSDLTGMAVANASLLDEATAAAEAMTMSWRILRNRRDAFFVDEQAHPQTIAVVKTRAEARGIKVVLGDPDALDLVADAGRYFGVLVQTPTTTGRLRKLSDLCAAAHGDKLIVTVATDLLALALTQSPGDAGADIVIGSSQRFGVPLGYGGPHAAFMATADQHKRQLPGRIIGVSRDVDGVPALRMALQTREQHIRRQKATSNICTAQVLLAVIAGAYAVYHGPEGITAIARTVHRRACALANAARGQGYAVSKDFFDTVVVDVGADVNAVLSRAAKLRINLRRVGEARILIALDETVRDQDMRDLFSVLGVQGDVPVNAHTDALPADLVRTTPVLQHDVFSRYQSETEMMRYLKRLENKDLSLVHAMIPLGSCTMKLNAATEMAAVSWPAFGAIHPFAPRSQAQGYSQLFADLETWLATLTGFSATSLQPNAGSQGEYAGLLVIRAWHHDRGDSHRDVCLIPTSAHGTNPASAISAGFRVVTVDCDDHGNIDVDDLRAKAAAHKDHLAALMVTYPSTHGVFEESIRELCQIVHAAGGLVYMDGANMNAMVGLARPGDIGADVVHLNLHKTFAIPHGGGGPGMAPICVTAALAPFLPGHSLVPGVGGAKAIGPVSAAPWGSASVLPISWAYIAMMGADGLAMASKIAILNANYIAQRLDGAFPVLYTGTKGRVAHECILDVRHFHKVSVVDVAKRLMDYGFHAPTMSWPVHDTLMIEPTESESLFELDRFVDAMLAIHAEATAVETGAVDATDNLLHNAPHTAAAVTADSWSHPYSRSDAAWPTAWTRTSKLWPAVGRVDDAFGDRKLVCSCPPRTGTQRR
ncbi:MAG: aminomethyl-transferring glycine dehydrogenase [Oligoflexia bacterium]|nr:aminomethyl-transferring glycine dehydrogenase [Oligoflexia bacterium]